MVRIFFLPYLGNRSKSDPCSYELFCLESHILSFPKVLQIPPESLCIVFFLQINEEKETMLIFGVVVWHFAKLRVPASTKRRKTTKNVDKA